MKLSTVQHSVNAASRALLAKFGFQEVRRGHEHALARNEVVESLDLVLHRADSPLVPRPRPPSPIAARAKPMPVYEFSMNA